MEYIPKTSLCKPYTRTCINNPLSLINCTRSDVRNP